MEQVKIQNKTRHDVGIRYSNGIARNITPNMVLFIPYSEFEYLSSSSRLFSEKHLVCLNEEAIEKTGLNADDFKYETDEEILKILIKAKDAELVKYLKGISEQHTKIRVLELIKEKDLANSVNAKRLQKIIDTLGVDIETIKNETEKEADAEIDE